MSYKNIILTFDVDWAPDFAIDEVAQILLDKKIKSSFFITHNTAAIERLSNHPELFELGVHPNFYPNSSHGQTEDEVMNTVKSLVPNAISMRTHGLYQNSNLLLRAARNFGIKVDVSLFLPYSPFIQPHILNWEEEKNIKLFRIPYFWDDVFEALSENRDYNLSRIHFQKQGLKIFNFHPINIVLNTSNYSQYKSLKKKYEITSLRKKDIEPFKDSNRGTRTFFFELIEILFSTTRGKKVKDLYEECLNTTKVNC